MIVRLIIFSWLSRYFTLHADIFCKILGMKEVRGEWEWISPCSVILNIPEWGNDDDTQCCLQSVIIIVIAGKNTLPALHPSTPHQDCEPEAWVLVNNYNQDRREARYFSAGLGAGYWTIQWYFVAPAVSYVDLQSNLPANFLFLRLHNTRQSPSYKTLQLNQVVSLAGWLFSGANSL